MAGAPNLPLVLRWIMRDAGVDPGELAMLSGVSPGAVNAFLEKPHGASTTWSLLVAALRCQILVKTPQRTETLALPRITPLRRAHEREQWARRRHVAFRTQVQRQKPDATLAEADQIAAGYVAAAAGRLEADLTAADTRLTSTWIDAAAPDLRSAIRTVADRAEVNAEDLALLSGLSLSSAQAAVDDSGDGRLAIPHRLFSALAARITLVPGGGGAVAINLAPSGAWRPEAPRPGVNSLPHEEIRTRAQRGESLASIAREAGVSRQRVHAIVNSLA